MNFHEFLGMRLQEGGFTTEDALASFLPLLRETINTHQAGLVAPLIGLAELKVENSRIWFNQDSRVEGSDNRSALERIESHNRSGVEVVDEQRAVTTGDEDFKWITQLVQEPGQPIERPCFLPGYVCWEHELDHHDPLTDVFSLGMILASMVCGLDLSDRDQLRRFVQARNNLFEINGDLHPVLARAVTKMTEPSRRRRVQDLGALLQTLENYRDQGIDFDLEIARMSEFKEKDRQTKKQIVLSKLKERLFEISRRNRLLNFQPTIQSVNLTHSSVPLSLDVTNIRPDQILTWSEETNRTFVGGKTISLNKYLNFTEAVYLPGILDRIITETRRDESEFGFAQLRLVACFLRWTNLKEQPIERFNSPFVLLPVKLAKRKGIRDTFTLTALESIAEINPVVRHQFRQLFAIELPENIDLAQTTLEELYQSLEQQIAAKDVAVTLEKIDRPRISIIHDLAKRRLAHFQRRARLAGRGIRQYLDLDYSYDPANYHPLGIRLYSAMVRKPETNLRRIVQETPKPRQYAAPSANTEETKEKSFYSHRDAPDESPYTWTFDLCSVTLANFKYRKMSLLRDYDTLLADQQTNAAFDAIFSLDPRPIEPPSSGVTPLDERYDVVPCDPTQASAIQRARGGTSYIIQGPPGTGKSQTITNLIADHVARGKRVLFVCEKRAAIDVVYARLRQVGLKELCCLIHDSQTDKKEFIQDLKQVYERLIGVAATIAGSTGAAETAKLQPARAEVIRRMTLEMQPLSHYDAMMTSFSKQAGTTIRQLIDRCLRPRNEPADPANSAELSQRSKVSPVNVAMRSSLPELALWDPSERQIKNYERLLRIVQPDGIAAHHPLSLVSLRLAHENDPITIVAQATETAGELAQRARQHLHGNASLDRGLTLRDLGGIIDHAKLLRPLSESGLSDLLILGSNRAREFATEVAGLDRLTQDFEQAAERTQAWKELLSADDVEIALEQASAYERSFVRWLSPGWWRLRSLLARCYDFASHSVRPSWRQVLERLKERHGAVRAMERKRSEIAAHLGFPGSLDMLQECLNRIATRRPQLPRSAAEFHQVAVGSPDGKRIVDEVVACAEIFASLHRELDRFAVDLGDCTLEDIDHRLAAAIDSVEDLPDYLAALRELEDVPDSLRVALCTLPIAPRQLESELAHHALELEHRRCRELIHFDGERRYHHALELQRQYGEMLQANVREIKRAIEKTVLKKIAICSLPAGQLSPSDKELKLRYNRGRRELEHEFGKTMRYKPIRELVSGDSGEVVKDLKPVWLMSPLSVSDTLPLDPQFFDVVIFDEASQITLEEAVPSICRSPQSIVVGDEMQLPPTDFFSAKQRVDEDEELIVEEDDETVTYDLESNSFLNHAAKNLPSTMLGWHYRSRSESLISYSNWKFYGGRLLTVPEETLAVQSREPIIVSDVEQGEQGTEALLQRAVSFHFVDEGVYGNRRNRREATYIASLVRSLLTTSAGKTIGIVAFSESQQGEIESALRRLASQDAEFAKQLEAEFEREDDGQFVGLLVKNLENIQGDERDIIILSVCYGPDPTGKMRMNFGPINKSGGEKRLNVAFSRAKHHMAIVSSIRHTAVTNDFNEGANSLKQYLFYAEAISAGDGQQATQILRRGAIQDAVAREELYPSPFADEIASAMEQRGYLVDRNVGQSHFRCHLAIRRPGDSVYRLGVLLDNIDHYDAAEDVLERDAMRPQLLRAFGWNITHVMANDWQQRSANEIERLVRLAEGQTDPWLESPPITKQETKESEESELALPMSSVSGSQTEDQQGEADASDSRVVPSSPEVDSPLAAAPLAAETAFSADKVYLEFRDDRSQKFWEITIDHCSHTVRFGRLGSTGQTNTKMFADATAARADFDRLVQAKRRKGYQGPSIE